MQKSANTLSDIGAKTPVLVQHEAVSFSPLGPRVAVRTTGPRLHRKAPKRRLLLYGVVISMMLIAFGAGAIVTWETDSIRALAPKEETKTITPPGTITLDVPSPKATPAPGLPSDALYHMTLEQLEYYITEGYKTPETKAKEEATRIRAERVTALTAYLESKGSPLVSIVETLVDLKHWRLVLAISNSESSLGRRCADNNCSGIGVAPGHALWQEYASKADWAAALDRLLERRYKDWTLEEMNGVYNQPGSENWVFAATQVLEDLKQIP